MTTLTSRTATSRTAMTKQRTQAPATHTTLPPVSFDTRLELASIGMDVVLSGCDGVQEAHQQAADATAEADRYSAAPETHEAVTQPLSPEAERVLKYAATIIRVRGWTRGEWVSDCGAVCAMTAVRIAAGGDSKVFNEAEDELLRRTGSGFGSVMVWNDRGGRTRDEVLRLLEGS